ncbi:MAG: DUF4097 family beta strand repeat-containing protein [Gaiellales bacterium]
MQTFQTPNPIAVDVELGVGDIRIEASERGDTIVEVLPSDPEKPGDVSAAEQTRVDFAGDRLVVKGPRGWRQWMPRGGDDSIDVRISLPEGSRFRGDTGLSRLRATGRLGDVEYRTSAGEIDVESAGAAALRTGAGDLTVDHAAGNVTASTGSGSVRIGAVRGSAVVKNSNRDTWIGDVAGDLRVKAANGSISVDRAHATVAASTANGDVRLGEIESGSVVAQTSLGKIEIGVRTGVAAWLDLDTKFGRVVNGLDDAERPDAGEDTVEVRARTSFGDITIRRASGDLAG